MCMLDIEVFDNSKSDSSLLKIKLSGLKFNFKRFDESKYHNPVILYEQNWTVMFTLRDVVQGTTEYSYVRIQNSTANYLLSKTDFVISKMTFVPFTNRYMSKEGRSIFLNNRLYFFFCQYHPNVKRIQKIYYKFANLIYDRIMFSPYIYKMDDRQASDLAFRDFNFLIKDD
ncbi:hypothetical protein RF11_11873 [Thelohanellus kitauei]|uniref:Uncharacterized protein n=1 Tax=Thelohanellus kitauei TaxID=669202 RepID=A0A0C2JYQ2_THEKT|nr:hypothetical protein RF11_11873 [Thelohanellus kitauei]